MLPIPCHATKKQPMLAYLITEGAIQVAHAPVHPTEPVQLEYSVMNLNDFRQFLKGLNV